MRKRSKQKFSKTRLRHEAKELKTLLEKYACKDKLALKCMEELTPFFDNIALEQVEQLFTQIPCSKYFVDDTLGNYQDLCEAYSKFSNTAEGVDCEAVNKFFGSLNKS